MNCIAYLATALNCVQNVLVDGGYTGETFSTEVKNILGNSVQIAKRKELHTFAVIRGGRW